MVGIKRLLLALLAPVLLAAAGCGDSEPRRFAVFEAQGLWAGTTSTGTFDGVVLDTGEYWFIYGANGIARSVVQGTGYFSRGRWRSDDGLDFFFGYDRPFLTSIRSVVEPAVAIEGEVFLASQLEGFSVGYVPEYEFAANPAAIAGQWRGSASMLLTAGDFVITIDPAGTFTASLAGSCDYGGRILPHRSGRNVFDITISALATCPVLYSANGVMIATGGRLVITAVTPGRSDVFYAVAQ